MAAIRKKINIKTSCALKQHPYVASKLFTETSHRRLDLVGQREGSTNRSLYSLLNQTTTVKMSQMWNVSSQTVWDWITSIASESVQLMIKYVLGYVYVGSV